MDGKLFMDQLADFFHLGKRHRFVRFVNEVLRASAMGLISDKTIESDDRSILIAADFANCCLQVNRGMQQFKAVVVRGCAFHGQASTPADRWKKRDIIIGGETSLPGGKLLISRSNQ